MSFYNNAFRKTMLGNGATIANTTNQFLVTTAGMNLGAFSGLGPGYIAILNPQTYLTVNPATYTGDFIVANTSMFTNDKYGMHGGYKMPDLSKLVRPSYAQKFYRVQPGSAHPFVIGIGANGINQSNAGCTPTFYCDSSYIFRIDIDGSPILRQYSRNMYRWVQVKTPCCPAGLPTSIVDPTSVFIQIAEGILNDPYLSQFVLPIVYSNGADGSTGVNYKAPSQFNVTYPSFVTIPNTNTWDTYTLGTGVLPQNVQAGIILIGAMVSTTFSNCSFTPSDHEEYQPLIISGQFVDMDGNPCETMQYCTNVLSTGHQGNGYGHTAQKDLLYSQAYLQNYLSDDPRIREINGGVDMLIDRTQKYWRIGFIHTVPRFLGGGLDSNLGVFNTDRFVIEIITDSNPTTSGSGAARLWSFLNTNLGSTLADTTSGAYTFTFGLTFP